jgi:hypothetical protein
MESNLTFFQTIIAGDSWGLVAIPVIEHNPLSSFIFIGSLTSLAVGILNLIVAIMVDAAAEASAKDTASRAEEAKRREAEEKKALEKIFRLIDIDRRGAVKFDQLQRGAENVVQFQHTLKVMDINAADLRQLFLMLDEDGSGEVDSEEFIATLYRMKYGDDKAASTFVKHYIVHVKKDQDAMQRTIRRLEYEISELKKLVMTRMTAQHVTREPVPGPVRQHSSFSGALKRRIPSLVSFEQDESPRHADCTSGFSFLQNSETGDISECDASAKITKTVVSFVEDGMQLHKPSKATGTSIENHQASKTIHSCVLKSSAALSTTSQTSVDNMETVKGALPSEREPISLEHQLIQEQLRQMVADVETELSSSLSWNIGLELSTFGGNLTELLHSRCEEELAQVREHVNMVIVTCLERALGPIRSCRKAAESDPSVQAKTKFVQL